MDRLDWIRRLLAAPPLVRTLTESDREPFVLDGLVEARGHVLSKLWMIRLTWGFVGLGLLVRLVRFWVCYPLYPDEAFVAVNYLNRDYAGLLKPLDYSQVAPPLFLWI